jgi:hypothetical protein
VQTIHNMSKSRIRNIKTKVRTIYPSESSRQEMRIELERLHEESLLVLADKACNNIIFVRLTITAVS